MLRLRSLGQTLIEAGDARLTPTAETVFATTLYLIVESGRPIGRDELTRLFWPGVSDSRAQHGLRQVLYKLKTLGATIKADRSSLILSPRFCTTDFAELLAPQSNSVLEALAENVGGTFLPGYCPELSEQFSTWVERQRDIVHSAVARALVAGMQAKKRVSDWTGAEQFASMCLSIDPLNEEATLTVAEAAALGGSKSKALSILNNYLRDIGEDAGEIKLPAALLRRRISEAYQDNVFLVRDAPFVGREEEMAELTRALARAQSGHGSAYVITGEPGIGKTRLVSEFTRVAALQRVHIVRVGCQSHDVRRPLSAFVDLVPKLLALPGALGCSPESMGYLRRLVAHDPEEAGTRDEMEPANDSIAFACKSIMDVLDALAVESCILLEIEDVHWLDPHSVQLIEEIGNWSSSRRFLLLLTTRAFGYSEECISCLALRPLLRDAGMGVARALASENIAASDDFVEWCVASSGGNPYYLIELLRNGRQERNGYRASPSLTRLLQNRVQHLVSDARSLLEACCVLGKHSTIARIESCLELPRAAILRSIEELDTTGMIELDGPHIICRHDLLSSVVLTRMSPAVKVMLHRFAAAQLELESESTRAVGLIWESAEHWLAAMDSTRAVLLLRRYATYLVGVGMPADAAHVLERAAGLATAPLDKYCIGAERTRALMHADRYHSAISSTESLFQLRHSVHPKPSRIDEVGLMHIQARWEMGDSVPILVRDCLSALSDQLATPQEIVSAGGWLIAAADNLCDPTLGEQIYELVVGSLNSENITVESRLIFDMIYNSSFGEPSRAIDNADELVKLARRRALPMLMLQNLRHASHVHRCHGDPDRALSFACESYGIAERIKAPWAMSCAAGAVGSIYMQLGVLHSAGSWLSRITDARSADDSAVLDANNCSYLAEFAIRMGNAKDAALLVARTVPAVTKSQVTRAYARFMALETHVALLGGHNIESDMLENFIRIFDRIKSASLQDFNVESLLLALESAGRIGEAQRIAAEYLTRHRRDASLVWPDLRRVIDRILPSRSARDF